jgi:hypothetical protein
MISHQHRCIFVHIPKCAGSSIEEVLWPEPRHLHDLWMGFITPHHNKYQTGGMQHLLASQVRQEVGSEVFSQYFKFAFVRNPFDKAVSQYHYMQQREDLRDYIGMRPDDSFRTYLGLIENKLHVQWEEQWKFIMDESGDVIVDFVGRFEHFGRDIKEVFDRLGIRAAAVPHLNRTERSHYADYYDDKAIEMVSNFYRRDLELFGYSFRKIRNSKLEIRR